MSGLLREHIDVANGRATLVRRRLAGKSAVWPIGLGKIPADSDACLDGSISCGARHAAFLPGGGFDGQIPDLRAFAFAAMAIWWCAEAGSCG